MVTPARETGSKTADQVLERLERLYEIGGGEGSEPPRPERCRGHGARTGLRVDGRGGTRRRKGCVGKPLRSPGRVRIRLPGSFGPVHTWAPFRPAGASTARSAWSPVSRPPAGSKHQPAPWPWWPSGTRKGLPTLPAFLGSRARCGLIGRGDLEALGLPPQTAGAGLPAVFVEAHIEQGPVLERTGVPLGIVTSIAGQARGTVEFTGVPRHAGATPMDAREDALCSAAEFVLHARDAAARIEGTVATVGKLVVEPGAANVVPGRVTLTVDAARARSAPPRRAPRGDRRRACRHPTCSRWMW